MPLHALRRRVHLVAPGRRRRAVLAIVRGTATEMAGGLALSVAVAVASVLLLVLLSIGAPLAAVAAVWFAWRSDRAAEGALPRLRARWGRSARVIDGGLAQR